jgi:hypothetical protein
LPAEHLLPLRDVHLVLGREARAGRDADRDHFRPPPEALGMAIDQAALTQLRERIDRMAVFL